MVKHFNEQLRRQQILQESKLLQKVELLRRLRRRDLIRDTKRNCLKRNIEYRLPKMNVNQILEVSSPVRLPPKFDETQKQLHSYKVALANTKEVLAQLQEMGVKNERPADYLVQMYKSDNQMFKVRRYLTEKQQKIKQKMQGKDWESKNKRKEKMKKIAQAKRARRKNKM